VCDFTHPLCKFSAAGFSQNHDSISTLLSHSKVYRIRRQQVFSMTG
jgi:hypothetical protein